ncbi:MAG: hypothetical protein DWQ34_00420 [Planctomycetota bacterium]|nr:MAG: hypothetical protein DWQ29_21180 [Planctomycetota bacterium]REJ98484.1 MAG: hypothetical protein DWQ34_00420 [Planctomycetota bacterium]REK23671.1 MAG: hypothetical protein DWQ41_16305 [Planctomycetota bacterium]REK31173.1 MAG: hypothetical protein DWQ45_20225 [Planctomycetota bacterium]
MGQGRQPAHDLRANGRADAVPQHEQLSVRAGIIPGHSGLRGVPARVPDAGVRRRVSSPGVASAGRGVSVSEKELIVVGGPNGAGKTTFAEEYVSLRKLPYISADAIAAELSPGDPGRAQIAASREFLRRMNSALEGSSSVVVESTLSGLTFRRFLGSARTAGFSITILFLFLHSPDTCVERVNARVRTGGHRVEEADVRRRFVRSLSNFWNLYRPLSDEWLLFYNSGEHPLEIAVGSATDLSVRDGELFTLFTSLVDAVV